MKAKLRSRFIIILIIFSLFFSILYFINYIKIEDLENKDQKLIYYKDCYFVDIYYVDISFELNSKRSLEETQLSGINLIFGTLIKRFEIVYSIILISGTSIIFTILAFNTDNSLSKKSDECIFHEIERIELTPEEMKVFQLIDEQLNYNKVFSKEKAMRYIQSRYNKANENLDYNGIKNVINSLIEKCIIIEGSKLTRKTVLLNRNRNNIYNSIKMNPGIYINKLAGKLKLSSYVIKWHLSILQKFSFIRQRNINDCIAYYDYSLSSANDIIYHILSQKKCNDIIEFLKINNKGVTKYQISKDLHMHYNTITKYLDKIDQFNLLIRKEFNNREFFFLNVTKYENLISKCEN